MENVGGEADQHRQRDQEQQPALDDGSASLVSGRPAEYVRAALPDDGGRQGSCAIWFIGSSSIHRWSSLAEDMAPWVAHNRGVDGATIRELTDLFVHRAKAAAPQAIVFYGGDNATDLRAFLSAARQLEGRPPVFVLSLKPSPARWALRAEQAGFNRAAQAIAREDHAIDFIDVAPRMLADGKPGPYYVGDGVHMNPAGYAIWRTAILRTLADRLPRDVVRGCTRTRG